MNQVSKDGQYKISYYARARASVVLFLGLTLTLGILLAGDKNPSKQTHSFDDLDSKDSKTRESAVLAIGQDKESNQSLEKLKDLAKKDSDLSVRSAAIQALGSHQQGKADLKTLLESETEPLVVRESAASALALFPDEEAVQVLADAYNQSQDELKAHIKICLEGLRNRHPDLVKSVLGEPDEK